MSWYYAENGTQKGPVTEEDFQSLVTLGQIKPDTLVWREGMPDWEPYGEITAPAPTMESGDGSVDAPEGMVVDCGECGRSVPANETVRLAGRTICATCKPQVAGRMAEGTESGEGAFGLDEFEAGLRANGGYTLDVGSVLSRGFDVVKANLWPCVGVTLLIYLTNLAASQIPCVGVIASLLLTGILMGGLFYYFLLQVRGRPATIGDAFSGFRQPKAVQLLVASLIVQGIPMLLIVVFMVPVMFSMGVSTENPEAVSVGFFLLIIPVFLLSMYLGLILYPTYVIVGDTGIHAWSAVKLSVRLVHMRFLSWILFALAACLLSLAGVLALCIGLFFVLPVLAAAVCVAWDDILESSRRGLAAARGTTLG